MRVAFRKKAEGSGYWYRLEVRDHATGSSEVCNATTALTYGLIGYLANRDDISRGHAVGKDKDFPNATVWCYTEGLDQGIDAVWLMTAITLLQMEQEHPHSIKVSGYMDLFPEEGGEPNFVYIEDLPADKAGKP